MANSDTSHADHNIKLTYLSMPNRQSVQRRPPPVPLEDEAIDAPFTGIYVADADDTCFADVNNVMARSLS